MSKRRLAFMGTPDFAVEALRALVEAGHDIALAARQRVMERHRVLNLMTHLDPYRG